MTTVEKLHLRQPRSLRHQLLAAYHSANHLDDGAVYIALTTWQRVQVMKLSRVYARHLLYVPFYLPSAVQHVEALTTGAEHEHADHDLPFTHHYKDGEVEEAVKLKASRIK
ncbi:hypothetical protein [Burkholderia pseudomultivorans]|uniref:hypothetical protein n=1 Tax=Burkholderia pseudomultivorans TaxID=1207504 RepID=UPI0012D9CF1E|nr:hypothetical protein [Burkholderia pseudomultivorans]